LCAVSPASYISFAIFIWMMIPLFALCERSQFYCLRYERTFYNGSWASIYLLAHSLISICVLLTFILPQVNVPGP
jgi:hypothetical protein